jgi:serine/threonine-protein kinase
MSPEQAMGERDIGPRSDVYALGAMTYEMLTGEPPFTGPNSQAIVAKVLTEQPPLLRPKRPTVSPAVEHAVLTALQKLPADRFGSAKEFAEALEGRGGNYASTVVTSRPHVLTSSRPGHVLTSSRPGRALAAIAATALISAIATWAFTRNGGMGAPVSRYFLSFPPGQQPLGEMLLTPDGARLVYAGPGDSGVQLWVKDRANSIATPLAGTNGAQGLGLSPDGSKVVFVQHEQLTTIPLAGGPVFKVADSAFSTGAAWLDDGTIVYTSLSFNLMRVKDTGERPMVLWHSKLANKAPVLPRPLPQARGVVFAECSFNCDPQADLWVYDAKSGATRLLLPGAVGGWYLSSDHLAYVKLNGELVAAPFDLAHLEFKGSPIQLMDGIGLEFVVPVLSFSDAGTLVASVGKAKPAGAPGEYEMVWIDRAGTQALIDSTWKFELSVSNLNNGWALSADGTQLAIGLNTRSGDDIWIKRMPAGPLSRLTFDSLPEQRPRFTPDGKSITYIVDGVSLLRARRADGTGSERTLLSSGAEQVNEAFWSPDGTWIVARIGGLSGLRGPRNIYAWRPGVDSGPLPLLANPGYDESAPALSPDGRWIAYESDETGKNEVYIRPFPSVDDGKWQVSSNGGQAPLWAHSGKELFYVDGSRSMVAVPVTGGASITLGTGKMLFPLPASILLAPDEHYTPFDISPDDRRFIMVRERGEQPGDQVTVLLVENWFTEVKSKLGRK